jgi:hypothetical protein
MLGTVLKQYNGTSASRIRPQSLKASQHILQSRILLSDPTILSSKVQQVPIMAKGVTKIARDKQGKKESKENLHRNILQADSTTPRIKDLHSSL